MQKALDQVTSLRRALRLGDVDRIAFDMNPATDPKLTFHLEPLPAIFKSQRDALTRFLAEANEETPLPVIDWA